MAQHVKRTDELTFNFVGFGYDPGLDVKKYSGLVTCFRGLKKPKNTDPKSLKQRLEEGLVKGIWVGMHPIVAHAYTSSGSSGKKGKSITNSSAGSSPLVTDPKALRVIVPFERINTTYYVLVNPEIGTGICEGINIKGNEVFFFPDFRDDELTSIQERLDQWPPKIKARLAVWKRNKASKKATITTPSHLDMTRTMIYPRNCHVAEIASRISTWTVSGDPSLLVQALDLLDQNDYRLGNTNKSLVKFISIEAQDEWTIEDSRQFCREFFYFAPGTKGANIITPEVISFMRYAIDKAQISLAMAHLRAFVCLFAKQVKEATDEHLITLAHECYEQTVLVVGPREQNPTFDAGSKQAFRQFLKAEREKIMAISAGAKSFKAGITSGIHAHGHSSRSLEEIVQAFLTSTDIETAQSTFKEGMQYGLAEQALYLSWVSDALDEHAKELGEYDAALVEPFIQDDED